MFLNSIRTYTVAFCCACVRSFTQSTIFLPPIANSLAHTIIMSADGPLQRRAHALLQVPSWFTPAIAADWLIAVVLMTVNKVFIENSLPFQQPLEAFIGDPTVRSEIWSIGSAFMLTFGRTASIQTRCRSACLRSGQYLADTRHAAWCRTSRVWRTKQSLRSSSWSPGFVCGV